MLCQPGMTLVQNKDRQLVRLGTFYLSLWQIGWLSHSAGFSKVNSGGRLAARTGVNEERGDESGQIGWFLLVREYD